MCFYYLITHNLYYIFTLQILEYYSLLLSKDYHLL